LLVIGTGTSHVLSHSSGTTPRLQADVTTPRVKQYLDKVIRGQNENDEGIVIDFNRDLAELVEKKSGRRR
jgi:hypothetical protein